MDGVMVTSNQEHRAGHREGQDGGRPSNDKNNENVEGGLLASMADSVGQIEPAETQLEDLHGGMDVAAAAGDAGAAQVEEVSADLKSWLK